MNELITLIEATALAGIGGTGLGGVIGALFKRDSKKNRKFAFKLCRRRYDRNCLF